MNNLYRHHNHHYRSACHRFFLSLRTKCCVASANSATKTNDDMPKVIYSLAPATRHDQNYDTNDKNNRIKYIMSALDQAKLTPEFRGSEIKQLKNKREATYFEITNVHSRSYYLFLQKTVEDAYNSIHGLLEIEKSKLPTYVTDTTLDDALIAAGTGLSLVDDVVAASRMSENPPVGFALIRPAGHHAGDRFMGGCFFNNVSIAARYAQRKHGLKRVFIIDFDAHHGNGTCDAFYDDPDVFYLSTHQVTGNEMLTLVHFLKVYSRQCDENGYMGDIGTFEKDGCYPVDTGKFDDIGYGYGEGATLNLPLPELSGDFAMRTAFDEVIVPCVQRFKPDIILVSAGYDGHYMDPTSDLQMTNRMSYMLANGIKELAKDLCGGRCVFFLEGGWIWWSLRFCIEESFRAFIGEPSMADKFEKEFGVSLKDEPCTQIKQAIQRVKSLHSI